MTGAHDGREPSPWLLRHRELLPAHGTALDLACGHGRHARWLAAQGLQVLAVDRDAAALADAAAPGVELLHADLEAGPWPLAGRTFDVVVVVRYLWRPRFDDLLAAVAPGGLLIYDTFAAGQERLGRPRNPDFLLQPGELPQRLHGAFAVLAFEQGPVDEGAPAIVQRVVARRQPVVTNSSP